MFFIEVLVIGMLLIGGIYIQKKYIDSDRISLALFPLAIGGVTLLGIIIHGIICIFDNNSIYDFWNFLSNFLRALILFLTFTIKTALAPIFTSLTLIMFTYFLFEYQEIRVWYFVEAFFDWIFGSLPDWMEYCYVTVTAPKRLGQDYENKFVILYYGKY